jgi:hypothetical protein
MLLIGGSGLWGTRHVVQRAPVQVLRQLTT